YLVHIKVEALDRRRLLTDLALVISDQQVNLQSASAQSDTDRLATCYFSFELADPEHLQSVLGPVRRVVRVYYCYRVSAGGKAVAGGAPLTDGCPLETLPVLSGCPRRSCGEHVHQPCARRPRSRVPVPRRQAGTLPLGCDMPFVE